MTNQSDPGYRRFIREHPRIFLISRIAFALLFATIFFEFYLISESPRQADPASNHVTQMKVRGGHIFVRSVEYYLDRGGYILGVGGLVCCLLAWAKDARRKPSSYG
jgi:hypothetical protein